MLSMLPTSKEVRRRTIQNRARFDANCLQGEHDPSKSNLAFSSWYRRRLLWVFFMSNDLECMVLRALLQQRRWRRGKRGWAKLSLVVTKASLIVIEPGMSDLLSY